MLLLPPAKNYSVYTLNDPIITEKVRYVGISKVPKTRFQEHCKVIKPTTHKEKWIVSLKNKGIKPFFQIIEDSLTWEEAKEKEKAYIKIFKSLGAKLVNGTDGGDGILNPSKEVLEKISRTHKGKKISQEHLEKMWEARRKRPTQDYQREATRRAHTGKVVSKETREKISLSRSGRTVLKPEQYKNIADKRRGVKISEERRLKMVGVKQSESHIANKRKGMLLTLSKKTSEYWALKKKKHQKISDSDIQICANSYKKGGSIARMAKSFMVCESAMRKYIKEYLNNQK